MLTGGSGPNPATNHHTAPMQDQEWNPGPCVCLLSKHSQLSHIPAHGARQTVGAMHARFLSRDKRLVGGDELGSGEG